MIIFDKNSFKLQIHIIFHLTQNDFWFKTNVV